MFLIPVLFAALIPFIGAVFYGVLFRVADNGARGRVREVAARCLGLFVGLGSLPFYGIEWRLINLSKVHAQGCGYASGWDMCALGIGLFALAAPVVLFPLGAVLGVIVRRRGGLVLEEKQFVELFRLLSLRLSAIWAAIFITVALVGAWSLLRQT